MAGGALRHAGRADRPAPRAPRVPTAELARRLVERLRPHARELGSEREFEGLEDLIERGTGADRQLAEWRANRDMVALVRAIVEATAAPGARGRRRRLARPSGLAGRGARSAGRCSSHVHREPVSGLDPAELLDVGRPCDRTGAAPAPRSSARTRPGRSAPAGARARRRRSRTRAGCRAASRPARPARPPPPRRRSARPTRPSSTNEYSSSCSCMCMGAASARGGISCSISANRPPVARRGGCSGCRGGESPRDRRRLGRPSPSVPPALIRARSTAISELRTANLNALACRHKYALPHEGGGPKAAALAAASLSADVRQPLRSRYNARASVDLPPDNPRRPRLCFVPDRGRGRRRRRRSSTRSSRSTSTCTSRATWACRSSTSSRRTTTPTTCPATAGSRARPARRSTSTATRGPGYDHEPFDDGWELALGSRARPRHAHARPPARAHRVRADRHRARRRAVGGADRRHAVRGRHRAARPGGRQGGGRARRSSARCTTSCCRSPTASRCGPATSAARCAAGPGMDMKVSSTIGFERRHNELLQRGRRGPLRRARDRGAAAAAAELPGRRRHQPRPADCARQSSRIRSRRARSS